MIFFFWLWWYFLMCVSIFNKGCAETKERLRHFLSARPRKEEGEIWAIFNVHDTFASDSLRRGRKKSVYGWLCYCVNLKHDLHISNYRICQVNQSYERTQKASLSFALHRNVGDIFKEKLELHPLWTDFVWLELAEVSLSSMDYSVRCVGSVL